MKPDFIKLEGDALYNLLYSGQQQRQTRKLVNLAHRHQCQVIANAGQSMELLPLLWEINIDLVQGDCVQPALPEMSFPFPEERVITHGEANIH